MDILVIIILFAVAIIVNLWAEAIQNDMMRYFSKPLLMPILILLYWFMSPGTDIFVSIALWLAFAGDVFLLFPKHKAFFMLGLSSFLACHIFYILYFIKIDVFPSGIDPWFWLVIIVFAIFGVLLFSFLKKHLGDMKIPVIFYIIVILSLSFICASRCFSFSGTAFWFPLIGSILFVISDTILAFNTFRKPVRYGGVYIMSTYIAAQLLIVLGILAEN
jgi:uncharacterized membrane protein YhhN